ncbi:MAG: hypothetical protein LAT83_22785 [Kiritimatiellae bacterium]|nr:hypothetical protein [Kiritimatiellia bacterium]
MAVWVAGMTLYATVCKRNFWKTFRTSFGIACLAFIPSCALIATILDTQRFGVFEYASFDATNDFRVHRYLPPSARDITVHKYASGHRAKYTIEEEALRAFLDDLWRSGGNRSAVFRDELRDGAPAAEDEVASIFEDLGWPDFGEAIRLTGPIADNGAGATYFYNQSTRTAYHDAGYW